MSYLLALPGAGKEEQSHTETAGTAGKGRVTRLDTQEEGGALSTRPAPDGRRRQDGESGGQKTQGAGLGRPGLFLWDKVLGQRGNCCVLLISTLQPA